VTGVVEEMTVKAGQKCTAIRRTLVPEAHAEAVGEAIIAKLSTQGVGDPREKSTRLGPVVSDRQRADVLDSIDAILSGGAHLLTGGRDESDWLVSVHSFAYVAAYVLQGDDPCADAVHDIEAFGPVISIITCSDTEEAAALAARGRG